MMTRLAASSCPAAFLGRHFFELGVFWRHAARLRMKMADRRKELAARSPSLIGSHRIGQIALMARIDLPNTTSSPIWAGLIARGHVSGLEFLDRRIWRADIPGVVRF